MTGEQFKLLASLVYRSRAFAGPMSQDLCTSPAKINRWVNTDRNLSRRAENEIIRTFIKVAERDIVNATVS